MKKQRTFLPLLLLAALLLTGCIGEPAPTIAPSLPPRTEAPTVNATQPSEAPAPETEMPAIQETESPTEAAAEALTEAPTIPQPEEPEEPQDPVIPPTAPQTANSGISETHMPYLSAYEIPLSEYHTALTEQWTEGDYLWHEMSSLGAYYYEGNPLENVGFTLIDLDKDGMPELIIGAIADADLDPAVFEIWTLVDGQAVKLAEAHTRNRYFLEYLSEENRYMILNEASNGSANFADYFYRVEGGALVLEEGIVFDATANSDSPWFYTTDEDWNPGNDQEIDSDAADQITQAHQSRVAAPPYYPFTLYPN